MTLENYNNKKYVKTQGSRARAHTPAHTRTHKGLAAHASRAARSIHGSCVSFLSREKWSGQKRCRLNGGLELKGLSDAVRHVAADLFRLAGVSKRERRCFYKGVIKTSEEGVGSEGALNS